MSETADDGGRDHARTPLTPAFVPIAASSVGSTQPVASAAVSVSSVVDPRKVPVWREATAEVQRQEAIAPVRLDAQALRQRFAAPPAWQREARRERYPVEAAARAAAVLVGLQADRTQPANQSSTGGLQVLLTQRTSHLRSHAGQIAFPGGKIDEDDASAEAAALREAREEVGLADAGVEVLGALPLYVSGTGYHITPVVALLPGDLSLQPNPQEVADVFTVPLSFLMDPRHHFKHHWSPAPDHWREWFSMPYIDPRNGMERYIWGVTAGILRDLYRFLAA